MENASKALIIAGAILLSILIIGLGMSVYNNATSSTSSANLDSTEVQAHNSKFLSYSGRQKGSNVRALINAIRSNNREYADRMIKITFAHNTVASKVTSVACFTAKDTTDNNSYSAISTNLRDSTTYFVTFGYMDNGCIGGVEIHIYSDKDF